MRIRRLLLALLLLVTVGGVVVWLLPGAPLAPEGTVVEMTVPAGASFRVVVDTLTHRGLVGRPRFFSAFARARGDDRRIRSGRYAFSSPTTWSALLTSLTEGRVLTEWMVIPEGFTLKQMAPRIASITGSDSASVLARLTGDSLDAHWGVPGPGLEGYLFPDSYRIAPGAPQDSVMASMVVRYQAFWTPGRISRREVLGLSEAEVVTLASIVQAEARIRDEMPIIASVYHNRLARGQLLQADPTVLYALGGYRARLLYAAMDSVADHPYNTYTYPGLPPGPIGAPGMEALDAALYPAETDYLYFVAHPNGAHIFSRTLEEHNRAVAQTRPEWDRYRREQREGQGPDQRPLQSPF